MENNRQSTSRHKVWRRVAKRERRRRVRRKAAQQRDADEERSKATLERSAEYMDWIAEREKLEEERQALEQRQREENERLWLEVELEAQKDWRVNQERKAKARQEQLLQEESIRKDFEAKREAAVKKKEEAERLLKEETKKREEVEKRINEYIDEGAATPEALRVVSESRSGREPCPFFTKTGACRYGDGCSRNHRRTALSNIILVPGFYNHFSLEKNCAEYDTDVSLEFEGSETQQDFYDFYESVLPELKSFGRIKTLKYCCNTEIHLRGNLYVEYYTEREAARAWRKLKGRYWAQRQLNCEFVGFTSWRNAVCGMAKCPKGRACNFLHTFRNPNDEYDIESPPRWAKKNDSQDGTSNRKSRQRSLSTWDEWEDRVSANESKNWCWSDSPEPENRGNRERARRKTEERGDQRRHSSRTERERSSWKSEFHRRTKGNSTRDTRRLEEGMSPRAANHGRNSRKRGTESPRTESRHSKRRKEIKDDGRSEKKRTKSRPEEEESDENIDANSNKSCTNAKKDDRLKSSPSQSGTPTMIEQRIVSAGDGVWDTTDSEGDEKSERAQ